MRGILITLVVLGTLVVSAFLIWNRYAKRMISIQAFIDGYWAGLKERRHSIRFCKRLPVLCRIVEKPGDVHHLFTRNISGCGLCLEVPEILPEGSLLDFIIEIPKQTPISLKGEVVWVRRSDKDVAQAERLFDTGIKFINGDLQTMMRLKQYLHSILKEISCHETRASLY